MRTEEGAGSTKVSGSWKYREASGPMTSMLGERRIIRASEAKRSCALLGL